MDDLQQLKKDAIKQLSDFIDSLDPKHAKIFSYWLRDYVRFLKREKEFDPKKLIRYKRGSIVKAGLGYRIGNEEGGLHYAVVIDTKNALRSGVVTIIPLTSVKPTTDLEHLHSSDIYLGDEIYRLLMQKLNAATSEIESIQKTLNERLDELEQSLSGNENHKEDLLKLRVELDLVKKQNLVWKEKKKNADKMRKEISHMKRGSIALVGQITTISKIRIYDPLYPTDTLTNIKISDGSLDKIDGKIKMLYTNQK